jgi:hypothetical protein
LKGEILKLILRINNLIKELKVLTYFLLNLKNLKSFLIFVKKTKFLPLVHIFLAEINMCENVMIIGYDHHNAVKIFPKHLL